MFLKSLPVMAIILKQVFQNNKEQWFQISPSLKTKKRAKEAKSLFRSCGNPVSTGGCGVDSVNKAGRTGLEIR